jgi:excisionase family DNA binding protein
MASTPVQNAPELLSSDQAAEYIGIAPVSLRIWRSTKRHPLPYLKVGGLVKYRRTDLDRYLEQVTVGAE